VSNSPVYVISWQLLLMFLQLQISLDVCKVLQGFSK
jgi:hypothetical protein